MMRWHRLVETMARGALLAVVSVAAAAAGARADTELVNGVVATVDGAPLTLYDLREYERRNRPFLPPEQRNDYEILLNALVESRLLELEFAANGIVVTDAEVDLYISRLLEQNRQTRDAVREALEAEGLAWQDYFERMRQEVQRLALINAVIRSRVSVSPQDVERAWKRDPRFVEPPKLEIAHIYLPFPALATEPQRAAVRARAAEIHGEVANGRGFSRAAERYSQGPTADEGGRLGAFRRGAMAPHFEQAVSDLEPGEVARPVETADGIHIVKLEGIRESRRMPLEEVEDSLREELYEKRLNERFERWASRDLREKHYIEIKLDELALIAAS